MLSGTGHEAEIQNAITKAKDAMARTTKTP